MDLNVEPAPFLWIEEGQEDGYTPRTRRRRTKKKKEFVGWGSKQLIEFLELIGKDTSQPLSQHNITEIINKYVTENKLIHPEKKKRVLCDERLQALFGRKSIYKVKVYDLLEDHLVENQVDSENDPFNSSEEREEEESAPCKRQKVSDSDRKTQLKKKAAELAKTRLAAIIPENIKLVYVKRTLVVELLKHPETFEGKVVGSYVRIKSDPHDIFQKNSHQLQLVTGVNSVATAGNASSCTSLQISGLTSIINISALSDDDFSEEECQDLHKRIKDGLIRQPTVGELEGKVEALHEDITKHWLPREIALLKNLIDRANEKGWRHRVAEYLDRKKLLQTPSEQSRLLSEKPKVKAEEVKAETLPESPADDVIQKPDDSPKAMEWDWEPCYSPPKEAVTKVSSKQDSQADVELVTRSNGNAQPLSPKEGGLSVTGMTKSETNGNANFFETKETAFANTVPVGAESNGHFKPLTPHYMQLPAIAEETRQQNNGHLQPPSSKEEVCTAENIQRKQQVEVIDLSDDDDDDDEAQKVPCSKKQQILPNQLVELLMWHYLDPQGNAQGPFSLSSLKRWRDLNYFPPHFRVWQTGRSPKEAVLLTDILRQIFPN